MIDMPGMWGRLADVFAAPRANVPVIAVLMTIVLMLVVLLLVAFAAYVLRRKPDEYVTRGTDGKPYLVVSTEVTGHTDPRRKLYIILAVASFTACLVTAYLAWSPLA